MVETITTKQLRDADAPDDRDKRTKDRQVRFAIQLSDLVEVLADWRTNLVDRSSLNQLLLLLRARLDDAPDLKADVYLMRGLLRSKHGLSQRRTAMNLFEGRRPSGRQVPG